MTTTKQGYREGWIKRKLNGNGVPWNKGLKGIWSLETLEKNRLSHLGKKHSEETKRKMSEMRKGEKHPMYGKTHSKEARDKIKEARKKQIGEKHPRWKGGITPIGVKIRNSIQYRLWRESIFARDNWICQRCKQKGGDLEVHHIKGFAKYPELRFAIDNGITYCIKCHKIIDNYRR